MPAFPGSGPLTPAPSPDDPAPHPPVSLPDWPGPGPGAPNVARIYDALLGGKDNYAADRVAARELVTAVPGAAWAARDNRAFLGRAVRFLAADAGISQFIDIGTGLPTRGHVHQITRTASPAARVVYADNDPVVLAHARALLADAPHVTAVEADVRFPRHLLTMPAVRDLIDFGQPVAVLLVAVLHFVEDSEGPAAIVAAITDQLAPGSYIVISHVTGDHLPASAVRQAREIYLGAYTSGTARTRDQIGRMLDGLELVPPGLTDAAAWRPRRVIPDRPVLFYAGIGRKPGGTP
jgi:hypothetical protein